MASCLSDVDLVALSLLPIWWWREIADALRAGEAPARILKRFLDARWPDRPEAAASLRSRAGAALGRAEARGIAATPWAAGAYPTALTTIVDPPPLLWSRGDITALAAPAVAIVGSRAASAYGLAVAERLAGELATRGVTVVSGLARGIDSAAHRGTLAAGGSTIAVLGSGADVIYPPEHATLARDIEARGAIVSELVPGTPPKKQFFPRRNRIISGLSRAIVIVEAGDKSGSLITARCGLEQGREVLAVPGNVLAGRNRGGHALLRDGAKIAESADDILDELRLPTGTCGALAASDDPVLVSLTPGESCDLDTIGARSGFQTAQLLPRLLELELQGSVRRIEGGRFVRIDRTCYGEKKGTRI